MMSVLEKTRMAPLSKPLQAHLLTEICWPDKTERWHCCYEQATQVLNIEGGRSIDNEEIYVGAPCYDIRSQQRFQDKAMVYLSSGKEVGKYAGLLKTTNGTRLKTLFILGVSAGDDLTLVVRDKRAYNKLFYTQAPPAAQGTTSTSTREYSDAQWHEAFERFAKSRRTAMWNMNSSVSKSKGRRVRFNFNESPRELSKGKKSKGEGETNAQTKKRRSARVKTSSRKKHKNNSVKNDPRFKCDMCSKDFKWKTSLTRHVKTAHQARSGGPPRDATKFPAQHSQTNLHFVDPSVKSKSGVALGSEFTFLMQGRDRGKPALRNQIPINGSAVHAAQQQPAEHSNAVSGFQKRILELEHKLARSEDKKQIALRDQEVEFLKQQVTDVKERAKEVTVNQATTDVLPFMEKMMHGSVGNRRQEANEALKAEADHLRRWSPQQVAHFLKGCHVSNFSTFAEEGVCGRELALFTLDDLMQAPFSLRRRQAEALLGAIADVKCGRY